MTVRVAPAGARLVDVLPAWRWERIWGAMAARGMGALVVAGRGAPGLHGALEYVTGYSSLHRTSCAVVVPGEPPVLVVGSEEEAAHVVSVRPELAVNEPGRADRPPVLGQASRLLRSWLPADATVGVTGLGDVLSWDDARNLCAGAGAVPVDATDLLVGLATTPGREDLDLYRAAVRVAEHGLREFRRLVTPGASVASVCAHVEAAVRSLGGRHPIVLLGRGPFFQRLADPEETVAEGDLLSAYVETGGAGGVWIEEIRLLAVGELPPSARRLHDVATEALNGAAALLRTDGDAANIARHVAAVADAAGVRMASSGVVGHGVGLGDRGFKRLDLTTGATLPRGCPVALHPTLVTADRSAGATVGGTYVVTDDGGYPFSQPRNGVSTCA